MSERELVIGVACTIIGAVLYDLLKTGSLVGVRQLRNKLSERSVKNLQTRIDQLQASRDRVNSFALSDRALYLTSLQMMFGMFTIICLGIVILVLDYVLGEPRLGFAILALLIFLLAIVLGVVAMQTAGLDTPAKISAKLSKLDSEIDDLKSKLDSRIRRAKNDG